MQDIPRPKLIHNCSLFLLMPSSNHALPRKAINAVRTVFLYSLLAVFSACSLQKKIGKSAQATVLGDSALRHAHVGISIYDLSAGKYLYNHNAANYFVPASNTKIITCYAALKYLGDSIAGIRYAETNKGIVLVPTGDPTFLHPDYQRQPVLDFLKSTDKPISVTQKNWNTDAFGAGWSWGDYNFYYSAERSPWPVYGNIINWIQELDSSDATEPPTIAIYSIPEINWKVRFSPDTSSPNFYVQRDKDDNVYVITEGKDKYRKQEVPFVTKGLQSAIELLKDTCGKEIKMAEELPPSNLPLKTIYSQKTDSVLKPMMYRSDNFFAEQLLLMAANETFGVLNEDKIIDTLLKSDLKELPHKPGWADGSGLSRFNLFTPQDFIVILNKMQREFGIDRLKKIFPTGGTGTLTNYYKSDSGYLFAKTGSLNGVVALSGFMYSSKNKVILFSVLINNHRGNAAAIRRQVEAFLQNLRRTY